MKQISNEQPLNTYEVRRCTTYALVISFTYSGDAPFWWRVLNNIREILNWASNVGITIDDKYTDPVGESFWVDEVTHV